MSTRLVSSRGHDGSRGSTMVIQVTFVNPRKPIRRFYKALRT